MYRISGSCRLSKNNSKITLTSVGSWIIRSIQRAFKKENIHHTFYHYSILEDGQVGWGCKIHCFLGNNCFERYLDVFWYKYCLVGRVFANEPGNLGSIPGRVIPQTLRVVLDTSLRNAQQYKGKGRESRVKWRNPGKGVAPFPTSWCSSYRKGSLQFALDYGGQLYS